MSRRLSDTQEMPARRQIPTWFAVLALVASLAVIGVGVYVSGL